MKAIKKLNFEAELQLEYSYTSVTKPLGKHKCSMELWTKDGTLKDGVGEIEWFMDVDKDVEEGVAIIGVWWNCDKELTDYDGVFNLPNEAKKLLNEVGITTDGF